LIEPDEQPMAPFSIDVVTKKAPVDEYRRRGRRRRRRDADGNGDANNNTNTNDDNHGRNGDGGDGDHRDMDDNNDLEGDDINERFQEFQQLLEQQTNPAAYHYFD
jgi:hypothetical protein